MILMKNEQILTEVKNAQVANIYGEHKKVNIILEELRIQLEE